MCGIYGYKLGNPDLFESNESVFHALMRVSDERGKEASGVACISSEHHTFVIRSSLGAIELQKSKEYKNFRTSIYPLKVHTVIGHSRLATNGEQLDQSNNHPILSEDQQTICIHNGIVTNCETIWAKMGEVRLLPSLDSKVLLEYYCYLRKNNTIAHSVQQLFNDLEGSASIAIYEQSTNALVLASNTGSLYYYYDSNKNKLFFASEAIFLKDANIENSKNNVFQIKPHNLLIFGNGQLQTIDFSQSIKDEIELDHNPSTGTVRDFSFHPIDLEVEKLYSIKNNISNLERHQIDVDRINKIKRCTKCILPFTTPFITFDKDGVCNFCNEHQPILYRGKENLENALEKYRSKNGEPDCLAAFSGGRDSSYGLHYLKKELGLNPLAYTYDWGMITDLARRNQARMLGQLGIEHLLLSADITKKRIHIQKNIKAWMKDPHLGMIPLFMQGDKQCEFYANQLMKKYDLKLMFFFRGNELEREEFKNGHCGIKDADKGGVIHDLPLKDKLKLLSFYGYRYLRNPAYFNASFWDTGLAYFSTYMQKHDYMYLWHYIPWEEEHINRTLIEEYNWETSKETTQMWRTDDGSSAFYNYIYYQVQGFTENDSFRSRQIREGKLSRIEALAIVQNENAPRYESLRWYFDHVGLDGDEVLTVVDQIKKLY
ncbi:MAG TPA: hypothetical protein VLZ75_02530 [Chitinophagales bacterium]|jgi:asparagine synthetase B (glutamine-hydrolysing)|nr:hypothetical protein [Chitinophagales bacterium]